MDIKSPSMGSVNFGYSPWPTSSTKDSKNTNIRQQRPYLIWCNTSTNGQLRFFIYSSSYFADTFLRILTACLAPISDTAMNKSVPVTTQAEQRTPGMPHPFLQRPY